MINHHKCSLFTDVFHLILFHFFLLLCPKGPIFSILLKAPSSSSLHHIAQVVFRCIKHNIIGTQFILIIYNYDCENYSFFYKKITVNRCQFRKKLEKGSLIIFCKLKVMKNVPINLKKLMINISWGNDFLPSKDVLSDSNVIFDH